MLTIRSAQLVGIHRYSWKAGKRLEILGVKWIKPSKGLEFRACFHVRDPITTEEDFVVIGDMENYEIIGAGDPLPEVRQ